jgi:hypothetical protein
VTEADKGGRVRPSAQISRAYPWGAYWNALFPPRLVTEWIDFKRRSSGVNVARRLWDQREYLRRTYESVHGTDPEGWPSQHPSVVLDEVLWIAHAACLRCRWFDAEGHSVERPPERRQALVLARRHETSDGTFDGSGANRPLPGTPEFPARHNDP